MIHDLKNKILPAVTFLLLIWFVMTVYHLHGFELTPLIAKNLESNVEEH